MVWSIIGVLAIAVAVFAFYERKRSALIAALGIVAALGMMSYEKSIKAPQQRAAPRSLSADQQAEALAAPSQQPTQFAPGVPQSLSSGSP